MEDDRQDREEKIQASLAKSKGACKKCLTVHSCHTNITQANRALISP